MQVVILAGGLGTRLSEETHLLPKPMVEIGGKPILRHIMKTYSHHGYNDFIICLGYKGHVIKDYFMNNYIHNSDITIDLANQTTTIHNTYSEPWKVTLIDTGADTLTGGRVKRVADYITGDTFMLTYGDGVSDINVPELEAFHKSHGKLATLTGVIPEGKFGKLMLDENERVISFSEKKDHLDNWINGGFMVLNKKVLDYIDGDDQYFEREPLERIAADGELMAYKHHGFWFAMDTLKNKHDLEELWKNNKAQWKIR